jgi:hypothetical protein
VLDRLTRHWVRTGLAVLVAVPALLGIAGAAYAIHLCVSARALINSARAIRTTADAEREIAAWRRRSGNEFWMEKAPVRVMAGDGDFAPEKTYKAEIVNLGIARLGLVELAGTTLEITMHDGKLRRITVTEWTAWYPLASVWIQEWFDTGLPSPGLPNRLYVGRTGQPATATVVFPSSLRDDQRKKAFAVNTNCLVWPSPCKTADDILPGVWHLDSAVSPG